MKKKFTKPFVVWKYESYGNWTYEEFETLKEAVESEKYSSEWVVMSPVNYQIEIKEPNA